MATEVKPFIISREFNAPRDLVWKAWTERDRLMQWMGPKGTKMTQAKMDLRPGGTFHYCLQTPDGGEMWGKWTFREVTPTTKIILVQNFSDAQGNITRHPMAPLFPANNLSTTTLAEKDGKTTVTIRWEPTDATEEEIQFFNGMHESMTGGWGGTFEQLAEYLFNIQ